MTVYIALYIIIALCFLLESTFSFGKRVSCIVISTAVVCIVGLRSENMGYDIPGYLKSFEYLSSMSFGDVWKLPQFLNYEKGYVVFNAIFGKFSTDIHVFLFCCVLFSFFPIAFFVYRNSKFFSPSIIIYFSLPPFLLLYSGLRQCFAIGFCMLSFEFVKKRNFLLFALFVALATTFHYSAIFFFLIYPLYVLKLDKKQRWLSVGVLAVVYFFKTALFFALARLLNESPEIDNNGAFTLMIFFIAIYIFSFLLSKGTQKEEGLLNIFYMACFCQMFSSLNSIAIRVGYYFMIALSPLLPMLMENIEEKNAKVVIKLSVMVCFVLAGLIFIYNSSWSESYPHYWFWE